MNGIDHALERLAALPVPNELDMIDDAVLTRLAAQKAGLSATSSRNLGFAAAAALGLGMASAIAPTAPAQATASMAPFGTPAALAPSTLLTGDQ